MGMRQRLSVIEQRYNEALDRMTGRQRVERTVSLFGSICEMLSIQVYKEYGNLNSRAVKKKIAERLYIADSQALELLKKVQVN